MSPITLKSPTEIKIMAEGGHKLAQVRNQLVEAAKPGITTLELDNLANKLITAAGGEASFARVPGYKWATCINVNEVVVHGIPSPQKLKVGDVVGIDVGMYYQGFHTDTSTTIVVHKPKTPPDKTVDLFLQTGKQALKRAMHTAKVGKRVIDLSQAMQQTVEQAGYEVVRALTGHGIGTQLHEEPQIPCFVVGSATSSPKLTSGMVLAIEIMYNLGTSEVVYKNDDGWTIATADGKISGLFEETVAITDRGPVVLTTA